MYKNNVLKIYFCTLSSLTHYFYNYLLKHFQLSLYLLVKEKTMKRIDRSVSSDTRERISKSLKGRKQTEETKEKISRAMKNYWRTIPQYSVN